MTIRKVCTLPELIPGSARAPQARPPDLFGSAGWKGRSEYECMWQEERQLHIRLPLTIVPVSSETETLFADVATYYSDFSPITAYSHVMSEEIYQTISKRNLRFSGPTSERDETQRGLWEALMLAEALTGVHSATGNEEDVTYSLCRRTLSFCLARAAHLYPDLDERGIATKWARLREISGLDRSEAVSATLLWITAMLNGRNRAASKSDASNTIGPDIQALVARIISVDSFSSVLDSLYPTIAPIRKGLTGHFDGRMKVYDEINVEILKAARGAEIDALAMAYFANMILPGSMSHTKLLARKLDTHPSVLIWYGLFSAISPGFDLRNIFAGIGSKLTRDLEQDFNFNSRPTADIAIEELVVLSRIGLRQRAIKPSHPKSLIVSLFPGIEIPARFVDVQDTNVKIDEQRALSLTSSAIAERDRQISRILSEAQMLISGTPGKYLGPDVPPRKHRRRDP